MKTANMLLTFKDEYWGYYLQLERDVIDTFRYVEPTKENLGTYSRQYQTLLNAIGSETDVTGKSIAEFFLPDNRELSDAPIAHWGYVVQQSLTGIEQAHVSMHDKFEMQPWKGWLNEPYYNKNNALRYRLVKSARNPEWWTAYNKTKHRRKSLVHPDESNYRRANLKNVLSALAGLFVLEHLFLNQASPSDAKQTETSSLFKLLGV